MNKKGSWKKITPKIIIGIITYIKDFNIILRYPDLKSKSIKKKKLFKFNFLFIFEETIIKKKTKYKINTGIINVKKVKMDKKEK